METRELILEATVRTFAEGGSRGATTRRIAEAAGVNEVTLFRHFGSKEALLREALEWGARQVQVETLPANPQDPQKELSRWCAGHFDAIHRARSLLRTSLGEFEENPAVHGLTCSVPLQAADELNKYLARLQEKRLCDADLERPAAGEMLMGAVFSDAISRDIMPSRYPHPPHESVELYVKLFLRGIGYV